MKINDIKVPMKVKLNSNFHLEDSFDIGTIVNIKSYIEENYTDDKNAEKMYKVYVSALKEDFEHNLRIAIPSWYNSNKVACLTYYDMYKPNEIGNYEANIYVMENDDCFDLFNSSFTETNFNEAIDLLNRIVTSYEGSASYLIREIKDFLIEIENKDSENENM